MRVHLLALGEELDLSQIRRSRERSESRTTHLGAVHGRQLRRAAVRRALLEEIAERRVCDSCAGPFVAELNLPPQVRSGVHSRSECPARRSKPHPVIKVEVNGDRSHQLGGEVCEHCGGAVDFTTARHHRKDLLLIQQASLESGRRLRRLAQLMSGEPLSVARQLALS